MEYQRTLDLVFEVAKEFSKRRGWAQQSTVLREVANRIGNAQEEQTQQQILTCWHDLFRLGRLSWGVNFDNPDAPFYHIPHEDPQRQKIA